MVELENKYKELLENNGGAYFPGIIGDEKKSDNPLTPIFESITNALEAIKIKNDGRCYTEQDFVLISLKFKEDDKNCQLESIKIQDTGIGFTYDNFKSFCTYKYNKKGFNNKGCGRFQSLLFFDGCEYESNFIEEGKAYNIRFEFSKKNEDSKGINIKSFKLENFEKTGTTVSLVPLVGDLTFNSMDIMSFKNEIIKRYILEFLLHGNIPILKIDFYKNEILEQSETIEKGKDIPIEHKENNFVLFYKKFNNDGELVDTNESVEFRMITIPFSSDVLANNEVYVSCKNEAVKKIEFNAFAKDDVLDNQRFLNFVSSDIFNLSSNIDNCRQDIKNVLKTEEQAMKLDCKVQSFLFDNIFILQEELENKVSKIFYEFYPLAKEKEVIKIERIRFLKDFFGIEDNDRLSIKTSDNSKIILEKFYKSEALKQATIDAAFSEVYENIKMLDVNAKNYSDDFERLTSELSEKIPLRNKKALSRYMTNRRIVLDLFDLTIKNKLRAQSEEKRKEEEKRLHNILFKQHSSDSSASNLWLLNEEFIYFSGYSEFQLNKLQDKKGKPLFDFSGLSETDKILLENRDEKRPDIILFPDEGKCIIIELKAPGVPVNKYTGQTEDYARIIASCVSTDNKIDMFYSFLIVEENNQFDIPSEYEEICHMKNAYFCPTKKVKGIVDGKREDVAYIYGEILRYEDIYERAKLRNKIFIDIISKSVPTK